MEFQNPRASHPSARLIAVLLLGLVSACGSDSDEEDTDGAQAGDVFAVTQSNRLVSFNPNTPRVFSSLVQLIGLQPGEVLRGIDFRPANRQLYGLGSNGRLYTIEVDGRATLVGVLAADPTDPTAPFTSLSGNNFGVDFNPVVDRLRVVSDTGQNLRINVVPVAGEVRVTTDQDLSQSGIAGSAYSNNFSTAATTTLFGIDVSNDQWVMQNPPNDGTITAVGFLNAGEIIDASVDIDAQDTEALAVLNVGGTAAVYRIDLATGAASILGTLGTGEPVIGLAIPVTITPAEP